MKYLKILVPPTDRCPERTVIIDDVARCEFFAVTLTREEFSTNWADDKFSVYGEDPWLNEDDQGKARIAVLIYQLSDKSSHVLLFNWRAMLCNDKGKAVEYFSFT